jgi:polar amino acid transport system ATP-binding protein
MAPYSGSITYNQQPLNTLSNSERASIVGYIFQEFNLFAHLTVLDNCIDPQLIRGVSHEHARQKAEELLESLGIYDQKDYYPKNLSGGERQRVAIARALLLEPSILLLDEPTANLDPARSKKLFGTLRQIAQTGTTLCFTSHDYATIMQADVIYLIERGSIRARWDKRHESMPLSIQDFFSLA